MTLALRPTRRTRRAFTLVELLVVIGIIAVLAGIILPAIRAVTKASRTASTEGLLKQIELGLDMYAKEASYYPPDCIPAGAQIINFDGTLDTSANDGSYLKIQLTALCTPPEALYYYLANPFLSESHPLIKLQGTGSITDINQNGVPEIVDAWGRPILYNRPPFPGAPNNDYNFGNGAQASPQHNYGTYDLYSVGADGQTGGTGSNRLPTVTSGANSLTAFCVKAMDNAADGSETDDICNWKK